MSDWFVELEPYYLAIGMTHEQYWDDDPWLVQTYKKAHENMVEMRNQELWMQGLYNYHAFMTALGNFGNALSGKKRRRHDSQYLKEPIRIKPMTEKEKMKQIAKHQELTLSKWKAMANSWADENGDK